MIQADLLADRDYTMVRAALVKELDGDATAALVLTRIHWRCQGSAAVEGWWRGTAAELADETGLKPDQVRKAVDRLKQASHLETKKVRVGGTWDQTLSYRAVIGEGCECEMHLVCEQNEHSDSEPNVPIPETLEDIARADDLLEKTRGNGKDYRFEDAWKVYPSRNGRKIGKAVALKEWCKLTYAEKCRAWQACQNMARECPPFPPDMNRWLKDHKWDDWAEPLSVIPNGHVNGQTVTAAFTGRSGMQQLPGGGYMGPNGEGA